MSYYKLLEYMEKYKFKEAFSVVSFLIGLKGYVDVKDYENICRLREEGAFDE